MDPITDKDWPSIRDFYGLEDKENCLFNLNPAQILYREGTAGDPVRRRNLYYTNPLVKGVMEANKSCGEWSSSVHRLVKFIYFRPVAFGLLRVVIIFKISMLIIPMLLASAVGNKPKTIYSVLKVCYYFLNHCDT